MSKKSSAEKKLKRKSNQEHEIIQNQIEFDIPTLIMNSQLTTKPEVGIFLKNYVKSIRLLVEHQKITVYPAITYRISKVFIDFLDGHQIISDFIRQPREYYLLKNLDELELKEHDKRYIIGFVQKLQEFGFIK